MSGDPDGLSSLREGFAMSREINDVDDIGRGYANMSSTLLICGKAEESLERGAGGRRLGPERGRDGAATGGSSPGTRSTRPWSWDAGTRRSGWRTS